MATFTLDIEGVSDNAAVTTIQSLAARADADTPRVESVLVTNHANATVEIATVANANITPTTFSRSSKTSDVPFVLGTDILELIGGESILITSTNDTDNAHTVQVAIAGVTTGHRTAASDGGKIYTGEIQ